MCRAICRSMNDADSESCPHPIMICYSNVPHGDKCCEMEYFGWDPPGIGRDITMLVTSGLLAFIILFLYEFGVFANLLFVWSGYKSYILKHIPPEAKNLDPDVEAEKLKVRKLKPETYKKFGLVAKDLCKFYNKHYAVKRLCLTIDK